MNEQPMNPFLAVLTTWKSYFDNYYEGLGTTYERVLLHKLFKRLDARFGITSVLEVPSFGMTGVSGINSMWWAMQGKQVTVIDTDRERIAFIENVWKEVGLDARIMFHEDFANLPFAEDAFDVSWNFASLWFVPELPRFASELRRITRKVIFISVPNDSGWGYRLREKYGRELPGIFLENIRPATVVQQFACEGWTLQETGLFDVPPWPDIAMKKEDLFQKIGLQKIMQLLSRLKKRKNDDQDQESSPTIVDFYAGRAPHLEEEIMRFAILENAPNFFKRIWAHHRYFIFAPAKKGEA